MISVSQEVIDLINADSRTFRAKLKHGDSVYDKIMSLKWNVCLPSSSFSVGNALSIGIQCTAFDVPVSIKGEELELVITIEGSTDEISIGSFTAEKPTIQNGIVSFNAYDDMSRAGNIPYNSTLGEGKHTVNQYVADVAETLGIGYISIGSEGEVTVENDYLSGNSCRNALAYLAGYIGRNCIIKNKKILMKKFTLVDYTMNADRIEEPELEDIDSEIDFIIAQISSNNTIMNGVGATGTEFVCPIMTESQLSNVANMLLGADSPVKNYRAGKIKLLLGDPLLELCDVIKLDYKDTEYIIPITSISFEYDGGLMTDLEAYALKEPTLLTPSQRLDFAVQEEVKKVLEQLKNIDGTYFYIRYSPNADGSNMTEDPDDKTEYIGVCSTNQASPPDEASAYTWSKFKGKDGLSNFFHVKYSNDGGKTFTGTDGETAGEYIGILVDSNENDSEKPSDYTWSKIVGKDGKGISEVINYYLTTSKVDGVTRDDFGGNTEIVTPDKDKPYLWNYEEIRYTSGNPTYTDPCIIGNFAENGSNGRGIKSITEYYFTTQTESKPSKSNFKDTVQAPTEILPFLWNYEKIEYTDDSTPYESDVRLIGVYGSDGKSLFTWVKYADDNKGTNMSDSPSGKKYMGIAINQTVPETQGGTAATTPSTYTWSLIKGDDGRGVSKVVTEYYLSTSETTQIGGSWSEDAPEWVDGKYLWTRLVTYYTDGTNTPSDPVVDASWKKTGVVDTASKELNETLANALGLHVTEYPVGTSKIRYYHSNPSLTDSKSGDTILVFNSSGFGVCKTGWNNGNPQFTYGTTFDGKAVWDILIANEISAESITAGVLSSKESTEFQTKLDLATGILKFLFAEGDVQVKGFSYKSDSNYSPAINHELKWSDLSALPGVHMVAQQEALLGGTAFAACYTPGGFIIGDPTVLREYSEYCVNTIKYDYNYIPTHPGNFDLFQFTHAGGNYISAKELYCKTLFFTGDDGEQKELKEVDTVVKNLSAEVPNLAASVAELQRQYKALLDYVGQICKHESTLTRQENVVNATCTSQGSYDEVVYCATCGDEISRTKKYTSVISHNYTSSITKQPTCTATGTRKHTCSVCGDSHTETIAELGHTDSNGDGRCDVCNTKVGTFYTITVEVDPTNGGTVTGGGEYLSGSQATLKATANTANGYKFAGWYYGSSLYSSNTSYSFNVTSPRTLTAKFERYYTVNIIKTPSNGGKVKLDGAEVSSGAYEYKEGSQITLLAEQADGYDFEKWVVNSGYATYTTNPLTQVVNANLTYEAVFKVKAAEYQTLTNNATTTLNVDASSKTGKDETSVPISQFTLAKFVAPSSGTYTFESTGRTIISNTGTSTNPDPTARLYNSSKSSILASDDDGGTGSGNFKFEIELTANATYYLAVKFYQTGVTGTVDVKVTGPSGGSSTTYYALTLSADPVEGGTVTGAGSYEAGSYAAIRAYPNTGYDFVGWRENGALNTANNRSIIMDSDRTLVAEFKAQGGTKEIKFKPYNGEYKIVRNGIDIMYAQNGVDATYTFNIGDEIELTYTPISGKSFKSFTNYDFSKTLSSANPYTFDVSEDTPSGIRNYCA